MTPGTINQPSADISRAAGLGGGGPADNSTDHTDEDRLDQRGAGKSRGVDPVNGINDIAIGDAILTEVYRQLEVYRQAEAYRQDSLS